MEEFSLPPKWNMTPILPEEQWATHHRGGAHPGISEQSQHPQGRSSLVQMVATALELELWPAGQDPSAIRVSSPDGGNQTSSGSERLLNMCLRESSGTSGTKIKFGLQTAGLWRLIPFHDFFPRTRLCALCSRSSSLLLLVFEFHFNEAAARRLAETTTEPTVWLQPEAESASTLFTPLSSFLLIHKQLYKCFLGYIKEAFSIGGNSDEQKRPPQSRTKQGTLKIYTGWPLYRFSVSLQPIIWSSRPNNAKYKFD